MLFFWYEINIRFLMNFLKIVSIFFTILIRLVIVKSILLTLNFCFDKLLSHVGINLEFTYPIVASVTHM